MENFQKAAKQGNTMAMHYIGELYYYGEGVEQNFDEAKKWYQKAAGLRCESSYNSLGDIYLKEKDYKKAMEYYVKGADLGSYLSLTNIGNLYEKGYFYENDKLGEPNIIKRH